MRHALLFLLCLLATAPAAATNPKIDAGEFLADAAAATAIRAEHLLSPEEFARRAGEGAIVLDARSRRFYDELHLQGAVSLPYTEFTAATLASAIPDFDTPVLLYCNNNFEGAEVEFATKMAPAALNLSTFVSLHTYGYRNVWELGALLDVRDPRLELEGTHAARYRVAPGDQAAGGCSAGEDPCSGMTTQSTR